MSTVPAEEARTENAESLLELATRMTSEITRMSTRVHEDRTMTIILRDMDAEQLEEIDNSLATVIAAAYLPIAKSGSTKYPFFSPSDQTRQRTYDAMYSNRPQETSRQLQTLYQLVGARRRQERFCNRRMDDMATETEKVSCPS